MRTAWQSRFGSSVIVNRGITVYHNAISKP